VLDAERMIYDAKAQEIDGILKIAAAAGSEWKGASSPLSPSTAQSLWRGVCTVCTCGGRFSETGTTPRRLLRRLLGLFITLLPAPPSRKNQSKNWVLVENEITTFLTSGCLP
jgi:hypothetical protein